MWTWARLRMELYRETIRIRALNSRNGLIIQVNVRQSDVFGLFNILHVYYEAMILRRDFTFAGLNVLHRMIYSTVSIVHFKG